MSDSSKNSTTTRRKIAAGGLVALAIAGLGLASASELNLAGADQTFQAGNTKITADCQAGAITVKYDDPTFNGNTTNPWEVSTVNFTGIDSTCAGKSYAVAYSADGKTWTEDAKGNVSDNIISASVPNTVTAEDDLHWALTIYSTSDSE